MQKHLGVFQQVRHTSVDLTIVLLTSESEEKSMSPKYKRKHFVKNFPGTSTYLKTQNQNTSPELDRKSPTCIIVINIYLFCGYYIARKRENNADLRRKRWKILFKDLLKDYAKNTTLHGLRYLAEKSLSVVEKLFWLVTFLLSVILCFLLIRNVWIKWQTSPVIVSFSEKFVPVEMVPFPSITICPEIKTRATVYNFTVNITDEVEAARIKLQDISLICQLNDVLSDFKIGRKTSNASVIRSFLEVSPTIEDYMFICSWRGNSTVPCTDLFSTVLTDEGVCFNFNSLATTEILNTDNIQKDYNYSTSTRLSHGWSLTEGYSRDSDPYPRRGMDSRHLPELDIILKVPDDDHDRLCNIVNKGFKIFVQHPADLPQASQYFHSASPRRATSLGLKFQMITTTNSLIDYSPKARQCYFPSERKLYYFNIYTASNCMLECHSNVTYEKCGCVAFYMPHYDSQSICTSEQAECIGMARVDFAKRVIDQFIDEGSDPCSCLPTCDSTEYDAYSVISDYNFKDILKQIETIRSNNLSKFIEGFQYSRIKLHFKEPKFVSMRRSELFGLTDFLANCGGLLGLFLGFSFLSLIEIVYFFTLRCGFLLKKDLLQKKKTSPKNTD
ncbi:pickpocket protein 28-like [Galleria mellonella]|uniref:Pickpocket protein 28-like n=1 Tax=Galleria mellonella TaxID=7137 RepID=A0ABM3MQ61_GALME|nr:pickpocket protein 28-like [Galleria mellonella]